MTTYYWENPVGTSPDHGEFDANDDLEAIDRVPKTAYLLYKESDTDNGLPLIIVMWK